MENEISEKPFLEKRNFIIADIIVWTHQEQKKVGDVPSSLI
jgi:hypothetical protein